MTDTTPGAVAVTLLVLFLASLLLSRTHLLRMIFRTVRAAQPGQRWRTLWFMLRAIATRRKADPGPRTPEERAFSVPDDPLRTVPYAQWHRLDSLVANARKVSAFETGTSASSLDLDGSVVLVRSRDDVTFDIGVLAPDGEFHTVTGPDGVRCATAPRPSIDHGALAWWQIAMDGKSAVLWAAAQGGEARVLHTESLPTGQARPWEPYGWVVVAGDWAVWTILTRDLKQRGRIGATSMDGRTYYLGETQFPTIHRDPGAERLGRRIVAVNIAKEDYSGLGQVAEVDLNGPTPTVRILRTGAHPGASVYEGTVVGYWAAVKALQLPGGLWVSLPMGTSVSDVISDGEWCVGLVFSPPDAVTKSTSVSELFHLPTGARQRLTETPWGVAEIRGDRVLWSWAPPQQHTFGAHSWVGELRAPGTAAHT